MQKKKSRKDQMSDWGRLNNYFRKKPNKTNKKNLQNRTKENKPTQKTTIP